MITWSGGAQALDPPFVIVNIDDYHFQSVHAKQQSSANVGPCISLPTPPLSQAESIKAA